MYATNTTMLVRRAEQSLRLREKEELTKEVEVCSKLMAVVRAEMDQLELMHHSLDDGTHTSVVVRVRGQQCCGWEALTVIILILTRLAVSVT